MNEDVITGILELIMLVWAIGYVIYVSIKAHQTIIIAETVFAVVINKDFVPQHQDTEQVWFGDWTYPQTVTIPDKWKITLNYQGISKTYYVSKMMYNLVEIGELVQINFGEITNRI